MILDFFLLLIRLAPKKLKPKFQRLYYGYLLAVHEDSYLVKSGYIDSLIFGTIRQNGEPIPWLNYPLVEFLKERLSKDLEVFEYGSGSSTLFFANRVQSITSVEFDKGWYEKGKNLLNNLPNAKLHFFDLEGDYAEAIEKLSDDKKYDLVIIDGRKRVKSSIASFPYLKERGVVIFDDTYRDYYKEGVDYYLNRGYKELNFRGLKAVGMSMDKASLLYKPNNNCLGL